MLQRFYKKALIVILLVFIHAHNGHAQMPVLFSMEKVNDSTYIDATEVDMGSWLSYYNWVLIHEGYIKARKVLPDSSVIDSKIWAYIKQKTGNYIAAEARYTGQPIGYFHNMSKGGVVIDNGDGSNGFDIYNLPVVGVSYQQVVDFCKWRMKVKGKYVFRLPTEKEWMNYCKSHLESFSKHISMTDSVVKNGLCATFNYYHKSCQFNETLAHLFPIASFGCDKNYVFDMYGNVSEMVLEQGIAKGGNYLLYASQCSADSVQHYKKPEKWLGFRCIAIKTNNDENTEAQEVQPVDILDASNNKYSWYVDERDGRVYPTVRIGDNLWFTKNLAYKPANGKYWAYLNKEKTVEDQGYLYTWDVATEVCPEGWKLPSKEDFEQLIDTYGDSAYIELRPGGSSGLCAYSTGMRYGINFTKSDDCAVFWSSSEKGKRTVWGVAIGGLTPVVELYGAFGKGSGLPVRCIKNYQQK